MNKSIIGMDIFSISEHIKIPKYKQIIENVQLGIKQKKLRKGDYLILTMVFHFGFMEDFALSCLFMCGR